MPELGILILMGAIVLGAFVAKGAVGFGESLLVVPLFLLFLDIKVALPVVLVVTMCADVYLLYHHHREVHWPGLWVVIVTAVVGVVGGTLLIHQLQSGILKPAFAVFVLLFALRMLLTRRKVTEPGPPNRALAAATGSSAGVIDAVFGTGGPPLIMYFSWLGLDKSAFRATFVVLAFSIDLTRVVSYSATGLFSGATLLTGLCLVPLMIVGALVGRRLHDRIDDVLFGRIAAVVLLVVSIKLLTG